MKKLRQDLGKLKKFLHFFDNLTTILCFSVCYFLMESEFVVGDMYSRDTCSLFRVYVEIDNLHIFIATFSLMVILHFLLFFMGIY